MTGPRRAQNTALLAAVALLALGAGSVGATAGDELAPSGRRPSPLTKGDGYIQFIGAFSDSRWAGSLGMDVSQDGTRLVAVTGIAPGPCEDRDFGHMLPGRDGATGPQLWFFPKDGAPIRASGSFAAAGKQPSSRGSPHGTVSVKGTFLGDQVRGRLSARIKTSYDTCTANVAFSAHRVGR